jgi:hypothetical protein
MMIVTFLSRFFRVQVAGPYTLLIAVSLIYGCTSRKAEERKVPDLPPKREGLGNKGPGGPGGSGQDVTTEEASAVIAISEDDLKKAAPKDNLSLDDLQYKVTYQDTVIGPAPLNFKNGKAVVTLNDLPANQIGDFKFEIFKDDKPQLSAVVPDVILPAEKVSAVDVSLAPASGNGAPGAAVGPGTATGTVTSPGGGGGGTGTASGTSTATGVTPGSGIGTGTGVAPSLWDGKSDKGNNVWKIIPL